MTCGALETIQHSTLQLQLANSNKQRTKNEKKDHFLLDRKSNKNTA